MFYEVNGKSLLECSLEDLKVIIDNPDYRENEYIDYKFCFSIDKYPAKGRTTDKAENEKNKRKREVEKIKFKTDVCSFANAGGGYLLFGVQEDKGIAHKFVGISVENKDTFEENFKSYLQGILPRPPFFKLHFLEIPPEERESEEPRYVVIAFIQHDFFAPYVFLVPKDDYGPKDECFPGDNYRIWKRNTNSNVTIPYAELKQMFVRSLSLEREVEKFRKERIDHFLSQEDNETFDYSRFLLFHLIPETFLDSDYHKLMLNLERKGCNFLEIFKDRFLFECDRGQPMVEGLRYCDSFSRCNPNAECRLYKSGLIECFYPLREESLEWVEPRHAFLQLDTARVGNDECPYLLVKKLWDSIADTIKAYIEKMSPILQTHRIFACISIVGCRDVPVRGDSTSVIDRDQLICNPVVFEDITNKNQVALDEKRLHLDYLLSLGIGNSNDVRKLLEECGDR